MILLDTHALLWAESAVGELSDVAREAMTAADSTAVSSITWYEIAWLFDVGRLSLDEPWQPWLVEAARSHHTLSITPSVAVRAASLSTADAFPKDPFDRLIYATAVEHGLTLLTKDRSLRSFDADVCRW